MGATASWVMRTAALWGSALGLLPQVTGGYEQDASEKHSSGRGVPAFREFARKEQGNKEAERCPLGQPPGRQRLQSRVGGGLAALTNMIYYTRRSEMLAVNKRVLGWALVGP